MFHQNYERSLSGGKYKTMFLYYKRCLMFPYNMSDENVICISLLK